MKKLSYLTCLIILVLNISLIAQPEPVIVLNKTYGSSLNDYSRMIRQTPDGGYLIAGDKDINGTHDIVLIKTDALGNIIWEKSYGFLEYDQITWAMDNALQILYNNDGTINGYVIVATTTSYSGHGEGGLDVYLIRTDANGNELWSKTFGGTANDYGRSVQPTSDGGFIIAGVTNSFGVLSSDVYAIKTDSNGNLEWEATYNLTYYDDAYDVKETSTGYLFFCSRTYLFKTDFNGDSDPSYGSIPASPGQGSIYRPINYYNQVTSSGSRIGYYLKKIPGGYIGCGRTGSDGFLVQLDDDGEIIPNSTKILTGPGSNYAYVVEPISDAEGDGYIVAGETNGMGAGGWDFWIIRTDLDGEVIWEQTYGGAGNEWCTSMQLTSDGGIVMTGLMTSFGAGGGDFWLLQICDLSNPCPNDPNDDIDGDGICGDIDNCPNIANTDQSDLDGDGQGDFCDDDIDGDGVYNTQDCAPSNPAFPATPGTTCNDGNTNTVNDVISVDGCFCTGTSLGVLEDFALFTTTGAVSNVGTSTINGHVGTNEGLLTGFGLPSTLNGTEHVTDFTTVQAVIDVQYLYDELLLTIPTLAHAPAFGSGETLDPGVYAIAAAGSLAGTITLDALGNPDAVFIFKFGGAFTTAAASNVILSNGAQACNVFWIAAGAISMGASTQMKGTLITSPGAITMATGGILEGRLLSTTGAILITNALVLAPCVPAPAGTTCDDEDPSTEGDVIDEDGNCAGIPCPPAGYCCDDGDASTENDKTDGNCNCAGTPLPPYLGTMENFALFTSSGAVSNAGVSSIWGSVGTNVGAIAGFDPATTTEAANSTTAVGVTDLLNLYGQLVATSPTNSTHAPAFGGATLTPEILAPGVYAIAGAGSVGGTLILDGEGDPDAVFIFKFDGAFTTGAATEVELINGTQSCNVFWISVGAIAMAANTHMKGTIISNPGAVSMAVGGMLDGRLLSTSGAIAISGVTISLPPCSLPSGSGTPCSSPPAFAIPNMLSFNAKKGGIRTHIDWMMAKDVEVDFYEVEVATDGNTFTLLNELDAAQSNSPRHYEAIDLKPAFGENFYRLKVNQLDGSFFYSNIRRVNFEIDYEEVVVYPNPAANNIHIALRDFAGKAGTIEVYNNLGQKMTARNYLSFPTIPAEFDVSGFTNGMYLISIKVENHRRFTTKFIVNKL
jgi:hypothetical protein